MIVPKRKVGRPKNIVFKNGYVKEKREYSLPRDECPVKRHYKQGLMNIGKDKNEKFTYFCRHILVRRLSKDPEIFKEIVQSLLL